MEQDFNQDSPITNEVRRVLSRLKTLTDERDIKTVMVTSAILGEGKSTTASHLAIAASKFRNTRTVLLDLDLRRPTIHDFFRLEKKGGVAEILSKEVTFKEALKATAFENLQVLTCGQPHESPAELLSRDELGKLLAECRFNFDLVIVDAPPVIPVTDTLLLNKGVDGALFVIKVGHTHKPVIQRAIKLLKHARIEVLGAVLNNMKDVLPYVYDYKYYSYDYYSSDTT